MKKIILILICISLICVITGFYICTISTDTVFIGLGVIIAGAIVSLVALIPTAKLIKQQKIIKEKID